MDNANTIHFIEEIAHFIAKINSNDENHVLYCGKQVSEISYTLLNQFSDMLIEDSLTLYKENGEIKGVIGFDVNLEERTAEIWGPFIESDDQNWFEIAEKLWVESLEKIKNKVSNFLAFYNEKNDKCIKWIEKLQAKSKGTNIILTVTKGTFKNQTYHSIKRISAHYEQEFIAMHDVGFPNTYYNGTTIINRLDDNKQVFVFIEEDKMLGYVYVECIPEFKEGSIEFIYVSQSAREKGVGAALVNQALSFLIEENGVEEVNLCVEANNEKAVNLYIKAGFYIEHVANAYVVKR